MLRNNIELYYRSVTMDALTRVATRAIGSNAKKERFEIILEPLQAITQLAMLSFYPRGTKLSIVNNVLYVQPPSWVQGIQRTYNQDQRDDLFYLFRMIARYHKFYGFLKTRGGIGAKLFELLTDLSKSGLDNIVQTYSSTDQAALLHTLKMYRTMLDTPELLESQVEAQGSNIDDVFIGVRDLYLDHHYQALYHIFSLATEYPADHEAYLTSINALLLPISREIKKWISENIVF